MKRKINARFVLLTVMSVILTLVLATLAYYELFKKEVLADLRSYTYVLEHAGVFDDVTAVREYTLSDTDVRITLIDPDGAVRYAALIDEDGEMLAVCPDAEVFGVRLSDVQYNDGNGVYYESKTLWYISRLTPQEAARRTLPQPDTRRPVPLTTVTLCTEKLSNRPEASTRCARTAGRPWTAR